MIISEQLLGTQIWFFRY